MIYERVVCLGYARNSTYLVGVWRADKRRPSGTNFTVVENASAKFDEDILIKDIQDLQGLSVGTYVPFSRPQSAVAV